MAEAISISVEETNRIRISLGLKPIPTTNSKVESNQKTSDGVQSLSVAETNKIRLSLGLAPILLENSFEDKERKELHNYENYNSELLQEDKNDKLKHRLQEAKERSQKRRKLINGKTLSDESNPVQVTDDWLNNLGKSGDKEKRKLPRIKKSEEKVVDIKVAHTLGELSNLRDNEILTLDDTNILNDDEEDTLTNEKLVRDNKLKMEVREKLIADSIRETGRNYASVVGDDDVDLATSKDHVKISNSTISLDTGKQDEDVKNDVPNKIKIDDLFSEISEEANIKSDYSKQKKTTKIKKNKMKQIQKEKTNLEPESTLELKEVKLDEEDNVQFEKDDDELQSILSFKRKLKQKSERRKLTPEEIADEVKRAQQWEAENEMENAASAAKSNINSRIIYDGTSYFLETLGGEIRKATSITKEKETPESIQGEEVSEKKTITQYEPKIQTDSQDENVDNAEDESPNFNSGLASTLNFLRSRDVLKAHSQDKSESKRIQREAIKQTELLKIKISIEERLLKEELQGDKSFRNLPKFERDAKFERLLDARLQEKNIVLPNISTKIKKDAPQTLESYNPDVKLSYRDDDGNELNTKQAFKYLSHQFHGVGPSKKSFQKKSKPSQNDSSSIL